LPDKRISHLVFLEGAISILIRHLIARILRDVSTGNYGRQTNEIDSRTRSTKRLCTKMRKKSLKEPDLKKKYLFILLFAKVTQVGIENNMLQNLTNTPNNQTVSLCWPSAELIELAQKQLYTTIT